MAEQPLPWLYPYREDAQSTRSDRPVFRPFVPISLVHGIRSTLPLTGLIDTGADSIFEREAIALLGEDFEGIVGSDRWWAYRGFDPDKRQVCWSHLIRDLTAHAEGLAAQKEFGEQGLDIARRLFVAWDEFQEHGDRRRLKREVTCRLQGRSLLPTWSTCSGHGFAAIRLPCWPEAQLPSSRRRDHTRVRAGTERLPKT